jgi:short-subunit dehydrogenase
VPKNEPRKALVTGASSGIGAALAKKLAARGIEVWLAARRADALDKVIEEIEKAGGRAHKLVLDVAQLDATYERLTTLDKESGGMDLVVANAGIGGELASHNVAETPWEATRDLFQVNLLGATATLSPFIPRMLERGHGHLVGVSSIAADVPMPRGAAYGASKAGLTFWLESLDIELRSKGVAVTIVHPGFVKTPLTDQINEKLPFMLELDKAVSIMDRGIAKRSRMVRFPFLLGAIARFPKVLPKAVANPLILKSTAEKSKS